jgi:hypothetical protein
MVASWFALGNAALVTTRELTLTPEVESVAVAQDWPNGFGGWVLFSPGVGDPHRINLKATSRHRQVT